MRNINKLTNYVATVAVVLSVGRGCMPDVGAASAATIPVSGSDQPVTRGICPVGPNVLRGNGEVLTALMIDVQNPTNEQKAGTSALRAKYEAQARNADELAAKAKKSGKNPQVVTTTYGGTPECVQFNISFDDLVGVKSDGTPDTNVMGVKDLYGNWVTDISRLTRDARGKLQGELVDIPGGNGGWVEFTPEGKIRTVKSSTGGAVPDQWFDFGHNRWKAIR